MSSPQPYVRPPGFPSYGPGFTLTQFLQTVFTGISGLPGDLVRPMWQPEPPKQPDLYTNWIAIGIKSSTPDANSYVGPNSQGILESQRHEKLEVSCDIYGPNDIEISDLIRDGFQIQTNLEALQLANMGFVEVSQAQRVPDFVNERWIDRVNMSVFLRREVQRTYPVPTILSASGTLYVPDVTPNYTLPFQAPVEDFLTTQSGDILETQSGEPITT